MQLSEIRALFFVLFSLTFLSCSRVTTLGKKTHEFGKKADQIIWIQVAGLSDEHLGLVKFNSPIENYVSPLENAVCMGNMWSYNLYDLRVVPESGFVSQLSGSKKIKNECSDYDRDFVWNLLEPFKFQTAILEGPLSKDESLLKIKECSEAKNKLDNTSFWSMSGNSKNMNLPTFHFQKEEILRPGVFRDRSCQDKGCFASTLNNAKELWKRMLVEPGRKLLIVRDFSFNDALKKKRNIILARERLIEIMEMYQYFKDSTRNSNKTLILLTSSAAMPIEFPSAGKEWNAFIKKGKNILYKKTSLLSSVWADGPGAENFCSYMNESEVLERILWAPKEKFLGIF